jgi:hypothetical protein
MLYFYCILFWCDLIWSEVLLSSNIRYFSYNRIFCLKKCLKSYVGMKPVDNMIVNEF